VVQRLAENSDVFHEGRSSRATGRALIFDVLQRAGRDEAAYYIAVSEADLGHIILDRTYLGCSVTVEIDVSVVVETDD
jgi:hypothetical protein